MKYATWLMILAISFWTINRDEWIASAVGGSSVITEVSVMTAANGSVITATTYRTVTTTATSTAGGPSTHTGTGANTSTNCHTGGGQYGGGQWNYCNRDTNNNQDNTQKDTNDLNNNGANKSTALGMAAIAAGMAMVAAGMALLPNPPTTPAGVALIAAGMALIAAGMAALAAAKKMNNNANKADFNAGKMDALNPEYKSTISDSKPFEKVDLGDGSTSGGINIDPALLRTGKMDAIYVDLENKTGIGRDDFANAMKDGKNPLDLLAASPAMKGTPGADVGNLQKMMNDSTAKGLPNGSEMMSQLGLSESDLGTGAGLEMKAGGGAGGPRAPASQDIDSLFPLSGQPAGSTGSAPQLANGLKMSPEVQAALDKNGITSRTIFEMVHLQYQKKTPQMFGVQEKPQDNTAENPFGGL